MEKLAAALVKLLDVGHYERKDNGTEEEAFEETVRLLSTNEGMEVIAKYIEEFVEEM